MSTAYVKPWLRFLVIFGAFPDLAITTGCPPLVEGPSMMRPGLDNGFLPNGAGPLPGASLAEIEGVFGLMTLDDFVAL